MIELLSAGMYSSIQDLGRSGFRKFGVPLSGVMDKYSATLANRLLGNEENCALLEMTLMGPTLYFHKPVTVAITGAPFIPLLNGVVQPIAVPFIIPAKSKLSFTPPAYGVRGYLAVRGGFQIPKVLGSYSFYKGITEREKLQKGDFLQVNENYDKEIEFVRISPNLSHFNNSVVQAFRGPEFSEMKAGFFRKISETKFTIDPHSNRMAYILSGMENSSSTEIITGPVQPGTVQLTPSGKFIVLMREAQTTGGYARILQLTENSLSLLAQKRGGEKVSIELVS